MNKKKFFAALTSAAMLVSQAGSVVFAQEMVEVEAGTVGGTTVEGQSQVKLDDVNFPGDGMVTAVIAGLKEQNITAKEDQNVSTDDLAKVTSLTDEGGAISDLTGIEYLTGLETLTLTQSPKLKEADLSNNGELTDITINPATDLYNLVLPEETGNLETLTINGASQLTTLDLSGYTALETVDLQNNELADLKLSNSLISANVAGNDLTGLDLSGNSALTTLNASNNNLYEITFPSGKKLTTVLLSHNKLVSIDLNGLKGLTDLDLSDNRLDVSNNASLANLNVAYNHLDALDLTETQVEVSEGENEPEENETPTEDEEPEVAQVLTDGSAVLTLNKTADEVTFGSLTFTPKDGDAVEITQAELESDYEIQKEGTPVSSEDLLKLTAEDTGLTLVATGDSTSCELTVVVDDKTTEEEDPSDEGNNGPSEDDNGTTSTSNTDPKHSYTYLTGTDKPEMAVYIVKADLMNRLYNPNSGEHFYTADLHEKDVLVELGWQYEGIGWVAPEENCEITKVEAGEAVFRLYNPNAGDHHYTKDSKEKDVLVKLGWNYEGVGWYSAKEHTDTEGVPAEYSIEVYREYNPNAKEAGAHNYTTSENENDTLVALGWLDEGIGWWALK